MKLPHVLLAWKSKEAPIFRRIFAGAFLSFGIAHAQTLPLYVNSGGTASFTGTNWLADSYYSGGSADSSARVVFGAGKDRSVFTTRRFGDTFSYTFENLPPGTYQIDLYFADWEATIAGQRVFDVQVNGAAGLSPYDIFAASGNQTATAHTERIAGIPVSNGSLKVAFARHGGSLPAQVNGIAITQTGSLPAITLSSCQTILAAGAYLLSSDIQVPAGYPSACFLFFNTGANTATSLNCQGHSITNASSTVANIVVADTVPNFTLRNCVLNVAVPRNSGVQVLRSPQSTLANNVINNTSILVGDSDNVALSKNTITGGGIVVQPIQQSRISGLTVDGNTIDISNATQLNNGLNAVNLGNSSITNNKITGSKQFTDDVIALGYSSGVIIQGNALAGAFDVGIEFYGQNDGIQILGNTMNSVNRGMGGWYDLSLTNSIIDGNMVTNSMLFDFNYAHDRTNPGTFTVAFSGNRISNNTVAEGCAAACDGPSAFFDFTQDFTANPTTPLPHTLIANNVLAKNNFDLNAFGPRLNPASGFVDGGGNICSTIGIFPLAGYPLQCGASAPCTSAADGQFRACYWPNESWSGTEAVNRLDGYPLSFNWGGGAPVCSADLAALGSGCPNTMSAAWTGNFPFDSGFYVFTPHAGGGALAIYIDGVALFNRSYALLPSYTTPFVYFLTAGTHTVLTTYVSNGFDGYADAELSWAKF